MTCPKCNHENDADARFCENCGAQLLPANDKKKTKPFVKVLLALALPIVWIVPFVPAYISATGTDLGRTASCFITVLVIAIAIYLCLAIIKKITAQKQAKGKLWFISAAIFLFTGIYVLRMPQCRYDAYWGIPGSDLRVVYNDSKAGLIEGGWWQKEIVPCKFDYVLSPFSDAIIGKLNGKYHLYNRQGRTIPGTFTNMSVYHNSDFFFHEGLGCVQFNQGWGFIDRTGKVVIPAQYDDAWPFTDKGRAAVYIRQKGWGLIDTNGKSVVPCQYRTLTDDLRRQWGYRFTPSKIKD